MVVRKILEQTLSAGSSSVVFTDAEIPNSLIRVYSSNADIIPISRTLSGNSLTVTYEPQTSNIDVAVEIVKAGLDIVDNLTSTDADKALSANMGKILGEAVNALVEVVEGLDIPDNITDLDDVDINNLQDGQVLAWDADASKFVNVTPEQSSGEEYSLDEKVVGKWVNGETLYQKGFYVNALPSSAGVITVATGLSNVGVCMLYHTWSSLFGSLNVVRCESASAVTYGVGCWVSVAGGVPTISIEVGRDRSSSDAYVFIRYTKTS